MRYHQSGRLLRGGLAILACLSATAAAELPTITLTKVAAPAQISAAGQQVLFEYAVTNTGAVPVTRVDVEEVSFTGAGLRPDPTCPAGPLAPGSAVTCAATYTVTQDDIDAGGVANIARAAGTRPDGGSVRSARVAVTVPATRSPAVSVVASATPYDARSFVTGAVITYGFVVTNTGNVTLTAVTVDGTGALSPITCPASALGPADQIVCTATYTVTAEDVVRGKVTNTVVASGRAPDGSSVSAAAALDIPHRPHPALHLTKTPRFDDLTGPGDVVTYLFVATNTGDVRLTGVTVDELAFSGSGGAPVVSCPRRAGALLPGAQVTCVAAYPVTEADVSAGRVTNTATASATDPRGVTIVTTPATATVTWGNAPSSRGTVKR